jgi:organic hydroperoxide reductase OsmC/OhrA
MDTIKLLFTATATATGGATATASERRLGERRSVGAEGHGWPQQTRDDRARALFAAGYAACFGGALDFVGKQHKKDASKASVTADVSIGPRDGGGFGVAVKLRVEDKTLPQAELVALAKEAHEKNLPVFVRHTRQRPRAARNQGRLNRAASNCPLTAGRCVPAFRRLCLPPGSARGARFAGAAGLFVHSSPAQSVHELEQFFFGSALRSRFVWNFAFERHSHGCFSYFLLTAATP